MPQRTQVWLTQCPLIEVVKIKPCFFLSISKLTNSFQMVTFKDIYDYSIEVPMAIDRVTP